MRKIQWCKYGVLFFILIVISTVCGCRTFDETVIHDELFTYDAAYDVAYLKVLDAVNNTPGWRLVGTDKEAGKIIAFSEAFTRDDRVTILVKRINRKKTSVELAPTSQSIRGAEEILKEIDKAFMQ